MMARMVDIKEYMLLHNVDRTTVSWWCKTGRLPGAVMVNTDMQGMCHKKYMIPADAVPVKRNRQYTRKTPPKPKPKQRREMTEREKNLYIAKYCGTKTYREIADALEMDVMEVRRRYDRLHEKLGV